MSHSPPPGMMYVSPPPSQYDVCLTAPPSLPSMMYMSHSPPPGMMYISQPPPPLPPSMMCVSQPPLPPSMMYVSQPPPSQYDVCLTAPPLPPSMMCVSQPLPPSVKGLTVTPSNTFEISCDQYWMTEN